MFTPFCSSSRYGLDATEAKFEPVDVFVQSVSWHSAVPWGHIRRGGVLVGESRRVEEETSPDANRRICEMGSDGDVGACIGDTCSRILLNGCLPILGVVGANIAGVEDADTAHKPSEGTRDFGLD